MSAENDTKKLRSIKDVPQSVWDAFTDMKDETGFTPAKLFADMVASYTSGISPVEDIKVENTAEYKLLADNFENLLIASKEREEEVERLNAVILNLQAQEPTTVEVEKPVPMELTGNQFIAEMSEENYKMARKCRPFLAKDKKISGDPDSYPNELMNIAVPYYLDRKYEDIVRK
jgi:hypothetical protein